MNITYLHRFDSGNPCCIVEFDQTNSLVTCLDCDDHDLIIGTYSWDSMNPVEGEPNTISLTQRNNIKAFLQAQLTAMSSWPS